jgi:hypothetical protein
MYKRLRVTGIYKIEMCVCERVCMCMCVCVCVYIRMHTHTRTHTHAHTHTHTHSGGAREYLESLTAHVDEWMQDARFSPWHPGMRLPCRHDKFSKDRIAGFISYIYKDTDF